MKKISLLFAFLIIGMITAYSHGNHYSGSSLKLKLWNNKSFKVILDGKQFNQTSYFRLNQILPGKHTLMVVKSVRPHPGNGGFKQVLYNGEIHVPSHSKVIAHITPQRRLKVKIVKKNSGKYGGHNNCCNNQQSEPQCGTSVPPYYYGSNNNLMSVSSFNKLVNMIANTSFDSNRLDIAKQALQFNEFTANQISTIMNQFSFESNRLKFAKLAYHNTVDKQNYFLVNDAFLFNSSIDNLYNYISVYS